MIRRILSFLPRWPVVDFYASHWIDEIWVRTTIAACRRHGVRARLVLSGGKGAAPPDLAVRYAALGVPVVETLSVEQLHKQRMKHVVTASSGIPRSFFGPTLKRLVHMPHSLVSLHMIYPHGAFDGYDTLFAAGPQHAIEWEHMRALAGLPKGCVLPVGYGKMDLLSEAFAATSPALQNRSVLIAPSWGETNLLRLMGPDLIRRLLDQDLTVVLRPHPSFFLKDEPELADTIVAAAGDPRFTLETSTHIEGTAMLTARVMVTDYSGAAFEFSALHNRPTVFVDLPKKVLNPYWEQVPSAPVEVALRRPLGTLAAPDIESVVGAIFGALDHPPAPQDIGAVVPQFLYARPSVGDFAASEILTMLEDVA
ncbi:MAG: CDP-glycerol glycerophosphotransferase family protein [Alsobacter sp.]